MMYFHLTLKIKFLFYFFRRLPVIVYGAAFNMGVGWLQVFLENRYQHLNTLSEVLACNVKAQMLDVMFLRL